MSILILHNGVIRTLDPRQPVVEALAIRDGRVAAIGSAAEVAAAVGSQHEAIDLRGRTVVPGLCDAHVHITSQGINAQRIALGDVTSIDQALAAIKERSALLPEGAWLRGWGWDHSLWGGAWPTAAQLDSIVTDKPIALSRKDGHASWVNSLALKLAGIDDHTADPEGGQIQRDNDGKATGILLETAQELIRRVIPPVSAEERQNALQYAFNEALSYGLTSIHVPPGGESNDARNTLSDLQILRERGLLSVRNHVHLAGADLDQALSVGLRSGLGDAWLRIGGLKLFADGTLGSQTADMLAPFEGTNNYGLPTYTLEFLNDTIARSIAGGICIVVHAIGDGANQKILNAVEAAQAANAANGLPLPVLPSRIEHAQILDPKDIARFKQLNVIASMQPIHATGDMLVADQFWGARCASAYAWRSLLDSGAVLAFGSDAPVESMNPWWGIHAAVTRQSRANSPADGWYPEQRLNVDESLLAYTVGPAIASGEQHEKGRLSVGMLADLAVLNDDPYSCAPEALHQISSELTIVDGKVAWEAKA